MDESDIRIVAEAVDKIVDDFKSINATRSESNKVTRVAVIDTSYAGANAVRISMVRALLAAHPEILISDDTQDRLDWIESKEAPGMTRLAKSLIEPSPYAGFDMRRGKGEKNRDRAYNRKLWGKGNSF